jgi:DNA repair exonuclease SbcCD ATPase subunit
MEAFIVDLSLKLIFSKFSKQPKSNFFIIDEGISVFDQERISNIGILFNFLSSISEHIFLISHLPTIKDFVTQSIEVMKDEEHKSYLVFNS